MAWEDAESLKNALSAAARSFDRIGAASVTAAIVARVQAADEPFPTAAAKRCLDELREVRFFDLMQRLAEAFLDTGHEQTPRIHRQHAQALLDQGHYPSALLVLDRLLMLTAADPGENREARGLLGRAYKQLYIDGGTALTLRAKGHMESAIKSYAEVFDRDPTQMWHGINTAALLMRAQRDGLNMPDTRDPRQIAASILARIVAMPEHERTEWDKATAGEACIALGRADEAVEWMKGYVASSGATAFSIASTLRQLTELWGLDSRHPVGRVVIPWMQAWLLEKAGGRVELAEADIHRRDAQSAAENRKTYEALLSNADVVSLAWYKLGLERCRAVARVEDLDGVDDDVGVGTGFLVRGADLCGERLGNRCFVLTNAHVVGPDDPKALSPERTRLSFKAVSPNGPVERRVKALVWTSPPTEFDGTLLEIEPLDEDIQPYALASQPPLKGVDARVYVIGHPHGGGLSFSINDNVLLDYDDRYLHYRAPTEGGSSGSPVFNQKWQLVALHHAGGTDVPRLNGQAGRYAANEGIWIQQVRAAICTKLSGG